MNEVHLTVAPAGDLMILDLWDDATPDLAGLRAIRVEPRRWWLIDNGAAASERFGDGALIASGGGFVRATLTGPGWRALLMIAGVFDAEDPAFGPGDCAATLIHHVPVWIAPLAADRAEVYFAASYAAGLIDLWSAAIDRGVP